MRRYFNVRGFCTYKNNKHGNYVITNIILKWIKCNMCIAEWSLVRERIHIMYDNV